MKKRLLLIFTSLLTVGAFAQFNVYHPFPDSNAYWKEEMEATNGKFDSYTDYGYTISGDTMLNGKLHHKIYKVEGVYWDNSGGGYVHYNSHQFYCAIREDSLKHVYTSNVCCSSVTFSGDSLLYDFNLKVGDTLNQYNSHKTGFPYPNYVYAIDSVLINNQYRKRFIIAECQVNKIRDYIIEGIGSTQGLLYTISDGATTSSVNYLLCFTQNSNTIYYNGPGWSQDSCKVYGSLLTSTIDVSRNNGVIHVYPNPANTQITISCQTQNKEKALLKLYNTVGQLINTNLIGNETVVDVSALPNGIYYYTLLVNGTITATDKLVVIH